MQQSNTRKNIHLVVLFILTFVIFTNVQAESMLSTKVGISADFILSSCHLREMAANQSVGYIAAPGFGCELMIMGEKIAYIFNIRYAQSGWTETIEETYETRNASIRIHNLDMCLVGLQYTFWDDWSTIRPFLFSDFGIRLTLAARVHGNQFDANSSSGILFTLKDRFDLPWSVGGGILAGEHWRFALSYGGGILGVLTYRSGIKHRRIQCSTTFFFM